MIQSVINIFQLGIKELYSLRYDPVMMFLIIYMFSMALYTEAQNAVNSATNAAVAIVDEDRDRIIS